MDNLPKYLQVAEIVRAQIEDGRLVPGASAPSGTTLAHVTGFSTLTCRKGLQVLIKDGVLVPGPSHSARLRVPGSSRSEQTVADAERVLSMTLAARRRAYGATQLEFAAIVGVSVTTVGHAETGRLWQSRDFWERADKALDAGGQLLGLHDDHRAATLRASAHSEAEPEGLPPVMVPDCEPDAGAVSCVTITWGDGTPLLFTRRPTPRPAASPCRRLVGRPKTVCHVRESPQHVGYRQFP